MSISSKLGVSQFMMVILSGGEPSGLRSFGIARTYTPVKTDNFLRLLSKAENSG
jgi:hypothetical protein